MFQACCLKQIQIIRIRDFDKVAVIRVQEIHRLVEPDPNRVIQILLVRSSTGCSPARSNPMMQFEFYEKPLSY